MVHVVKSHRLAHGAALAVCTILNRAGALTEIIKNDYGEDLLVQTQLRDVADNFNILVQVKGRNLKKTKSGYHSVSIKIKHIERWVNHVQPVLVCIFDEFSGKIFAFYPRDMFSLWDLANSKIDTTTVRLTDKNQFDESTATKFIWTCRVDYYSRMLAWYENRLRYAETARPKRRIRQDGNIVTFSFLKSIGILENDDGLPVKFREWVENASINFSKRNIHSPKDPLKLRDVFILCLLATTEETAGVGLPTNLMEHGTDMVATFFKIYYPADWLLISERLNERKWLSHVVSQKHLEKRA